jgi:phenylacetate-coenzyme A ligase PaaK-like adenylate-forming protein
MDGWRDSFNFADLVLRALENTEYIEGHRIVKEAGIKFGLFTEDGNIWDYYPYWHNWISFTLEAGVVHSTPEIYQNLL